MVHAGVATILGTMTVMVAMAVTAPATTTTMKRRRRRRRRAVISTHNLPVAHPQLDNDIWGRPEDLEGARGIGGSEYAHIVSLVAASIHLCR